MVVARADREVRVVRVDHDGLSVVVEREEGDAIGNPAGVHVIDLSDYQPRRRPSK